MASLLSREFFRTTHALPHKWAGIASHHGVALPTELRRHYHRWILIMSWEKQVS